MDRRARFEQEKCKCPGVCVFPNNVEMKSSLNRLGDLNSAVASARFVFSFGSCAFEPFSVAFPGITKGQWHRFNCNYCRGVLWRPHIPGSGDRGGVREERRDRKLRSGCKINE